MNIWNEIIANPSLFYQKALQYEDFIFDNEIPQQIPTNKKINSYHSENFNKLLQKYNNKNEGALFYTLFKHSFRGFFNFKVNGDIKMSFGFEKKKILRDFNSFNLEKLKQIELLFKP
ncbi:hypothetical protein CWO85_00955 [Candidatus Phytoplasma ziziphi]|uniref:Uncharacterized protein n=1 Tax=Ziziphus jujuba witches'-broom phytoplasma TaxID=135727 RepID=A0A660HMU3_ZIZJU|nr:hypothetical protein CWO85_00955 [Candidatus Phytoplasma ziziphi]